MTCTRCIILWQFYQHDMYYFDHFTSMMCITLTVLPAWCVRLAVLPAWHVLLWQFTSMICTTLTVYCHDMYYSDSFSSMTCTTLTVLTAWCVLLWVFQHDMYYSWQCYQHDVYCSASFTSMTCTILTVLPAWHALLWLQPCHWPVSIIWIIYSSVAAVPDVNSDKDNPAL